MFRLIALCLIAFTLTGCSTLGLGGKLQAPRNDSARKLIALHQQDESGTETVQLAFVSDRGNWYSWKNFANAKRVSHITKKPQNWIITHKDIHRKTISTAPTQMSHEYGILPLENYSDKQPMQQLVNANISYPGLKERPKVLQNIISARNSPLWKHSAPPKKLLDRILPAFDNFIDNGLIRRNTLATEDLHVIDAVQFDNGDRVISLAVSTLSNSNICDTEKRFKSFYIKADTIITDLTARQDVNLNNLGSTGMNVRFIDAVNHEGDIAVLFWYWDGLEKGYRLYVPRNNASKKMQLYTVKP